MYLSEIGKIVRTEWIKTPEIRPDMNLELDEFVIMPNHFHAILIIGSNKYNSGMGAMHYFPNNGNSNGNMFGPQSKNLAAVIRGFKSSVTIQSRKIDPYFRWQSRFYEHIIRNDQAFYCIQQYIISNPKNWSIC